MPYVSGAGKYEAVAKLNQKGVVKMGDGREVERIITLREYADSMFLHGPPQERYQWLRMGMFATWPEFSEGFDEQEIDFLPSDKWNPWFETMLKGFVNDSYAVKRGDSIFRFIGLIGAAGCGKTHAAGAFAVQWWKADPRNSIAIMTSTTKEMLRRRVWPVISHFATTATDVATGKPLKIGHLIDSKMEIRADELDSKHAIFGLAVKDGETSKAVMNLRGQHAPRMLLVIDEANGTPEAIYQTIPNMRKGCKDFTVIIIGNAGSRLDPHGMALKPENGWASVGEEKRVWRTEGVHEWQLEPGVALRFDGKDSPNVRAGKNLYPYIYRVEDWENAQKYVGTPWFYVMDRAMHTPDGFANTIFTEQLLERCDSGDQFTFDGPERFTLAFLDPAFGGDECFLQFAEMGTVGGKWCVQLMDGFAVPIDPSAASHDVDYQIARRVQQECITRRVQPHCFGLDATGIGRGVGAILAAEWSPTIRYMNWGGSPTDRPSAQQDQRPAKEVYSNFVTELWYSVRETLEAGQIKGFSRQARIQFCSRMYEMKGKKLYIETKDKMKARLGHSPDEADAVSGVLEVAKRNGMSVEGKIAVVQNSQWTAYSKRLQEESGLELDEMAAVGTDGGWAEELYAQ